MADTLLKSILAKIDTLDHTPVMWARELKNIARGDFDTADAKNVCHSLFDWYVQISQEDLDDSDRQLLAVNPDSLTDPRERKKLLRKQRKAQKRAKHKNRTHTSKITPELVETVTQTVAGNTPVQACDKLAFLSLCAPFLNVHELHQLHAQLNPVAVSWMAPDNAVTTSETLKTVADSPLGSKIGSLVYVYLHAHSGYLKETENTAGRADAVRKRPRGKKLGVDEYLEAFDKNSTTKQTMVWATGTKIDNQHLLKTVNMKKLTGSQKLLLAAADVSYVFKPTIDYNESVEQFHKIVNWGQKRRDGLKETDIDSLLESWSKQSDFKIPIDAVLVEEKIGSCTVTTISDETTLRANGTYMGNCTYSAHRNSYKNGNAVLFKVTDSNNHVHNVEIYNRPDTWAHRESAGRHNRPVSGEVRAIRGQLEKIVRDAARCDPGWKD